ncbi:MAG: MBL fold metallo-hydrolase [Proteobacteria bacterium]|nr:MBL fold metallo-hydrolase [Pseudomonadota bacterium]
MINVRWLGAAGLEIGFQGKTILIDPFLPRYTMVELASGPLNPRLDAIKAYAMIHLFALHWEYLSMLSDNGTICFCWNISWFSSGSIIA